MAEDSPGSGGTRSLPGALGGVVTLIPIRSLESAKSRLGGPLDAEERQALVRALAERTIRAARAVTGIWRVLVVSSDDEVLHLAGTLGADPLRETGVGLNEALDEGCAAAMAGGADSILALPADLPRITATAIEAVLSAATEAVGLPASRGRCVILVPDRHGEGTNALLVSPPRAIPFAFGPGSRHRHARLAAAARITYRELLESPLSLDLDTPEDLLLAGADAVESGR